MGPLAGFKIVEMFCIGPGPFAGMMLADMGADVLRVDRPVERDYGYPDHKYRTLYRNRRSVALDLNTDEGHETLMRLIEQADGLIEGNRPGVAEKLGMGPDVCLERNPKLVYGRMTGYGQDGPLAQKAGFDINYISMSGALHAVGHADRPPVPPLILAGDFGGGGMFLATGMLAAMLEAGRSGEGQVVDASMVDGSAALMSYIYGGHAAGAWANERESNTVDGGHYVYHAYECADGKYVSVGALLDNFFENLRDKLALDPAEFPTRTTRDTWPAKREKLADVFKTRTRDEWVELFADTDACLAPVLDLEEAPHHPHNMERKTFTEHGGVVQPSPAPKFSRTPSEIVREPPTNGQHTDEALTDWGFDAAELAHLHERNAIH